jgi:hypothetical protein
MYHSASWRAAWFHQVLESANRCLRRSILRQPRALTSDQAHVNPALRHQPPGAASQSRGPGSLPPDAVVQQQPQAVVVKLPKPWPTRLTFLPSRLTASVGPLEQPSVAWKARTSACQARTVPASRDSSATRRRLPSGSSAPARPGRGPGRRRHRPRAAAPCPARRPPPHTRITGGQPSPQPHSSPAGEPLLSGQQQLADAVQRIALVAPMPQGSLLGPPADLINHGVGQLDGMEGLCCVAPTRGRLKRRPRSWIRPPAPARRTRPPPAGPLAPQPPARNGRAGGSAPRHARR